MQNSRLKEAKREYENAVIFFNTCPPEYFEPANTYLTYAEIRLNKELRNAKENKL